MNPIRDKSYAFALHIVVFCKKLQQGQKEYVLSKQLLRSGTSVGANVEEAQKAQSKRDFASKCAIALKEAYESRFWLRLICDSGCSSRSETAPLSKDIEEIIRLLAAIVKSANKNLSL
ncbi:TPA: four helix bundle protein [Candidatus Peribacteria bacterium]|nr:MAG: four helix bundle protein [Candidatus Peribacteria bacterium RIFOXYC2_FULL_58_10]OGJ85241.1 MAG: four helix bundle protein [Candidatus Peribacteria bacterium RIFOXYD2_FULL_58_15]HAI98313.1 four helix bundle protein [Candidatus Peribacteria bacterium]HAS33937.1 four helix bundle protein [Candidatus Peribacteria bacterium]